MSEAAAPSGRPARLCQLRPPGARARQHGSDGPRLRNSCAVAPAGRRGRGKRILWNMVRIIVGTLVQVGVGRYNPQEVPQMIEAKSRQAAGPTAPPHGLYLHWIRMRQTSRSLRPKRPSTSIRKRCNSLIPACNERSRRLVPRFPSRASARSSGFPVRIRNICARRACRPSFSTRTTLFSSGSRPPTRKTTAIRRHFPVIRSSSPSTRPPPAAAPAWRNGIVSREGPS